MKIYKMSLLFDSSGSEYVYTNTQPLTVKPVTISAWFKSTTIAGDGVICAISNNSDEYFMIQARGSQAGDPVAALEYATGWEWASSDGFTADTWHHATGTFVSAIERSAFLDGTGKNIDIDSMDVNFSLLSKIIVGSYKSSTGFFDGKIAEVAVWSTELTDAQILRIGSGTLPSEVESGSLVAYWKLRGNYLDSSGNNNTLSVGNGTPSFDISDNPDVFNYPIYNLTPISRLVVAGNNTIYYESI